MFYITLLLVFIAQVNAIEPDVETKYGTVSGLEYYTWNGDVYTYYYLGVPYAKPPTDYGRFRKPQAPETWKGLRNAFAFAPACIQGSLQAFKLPPAGASEDCLYLNVFAPADDVNGGHPVMVFIHGGGYVSGSAFEYGVEGILENLVARGVVVVTINYRLGVYGFFASGNGDGNWGIWDQLAALKWVRENIANFGGDPYQVTIFGESAGAGSVSLLSILPKAQMYFTRSISQSGSALSKWVVNDRVVRTSRLVAENVGCVGLPLSCMQTKTVDSLKTAEFFIFLSASADDNTGGEVATDYVIWSPVVDGNLIPEHPDKLITSSILKPAIIGTNADELVIFVRPPPKLQLVPSLLIDSLVGDRYSAAGVETLISSELSYKFGIDPSSKVYGPAMEAGKKVYLKRAVYQEGINNQTYFVQSYINLQSDLAMHMPALRESLTRVRRNVSTWLYDFDYYPQNLYGDSYPWRSAHHMIEIPFIFDSNLTGAFEFKRSNADKKLTNVIGTLWTNFAKYGEPTPTFFKNGPFVQSRLNFTWPKLLTKGGFRNLKIKPNPQVNRWYHFEATNYWVEYLPFLKRVEQSYRRFEIKTPATTTQTPTTTTRLF